MWLNLYLFSNKFVFSVLDNVKPFCWNYIFIEILFRQCIMSCRVSVWDGIWLLLLGIFPNLLRHINCLILLFCVANLQVWKLIVYTCQFHVLLRIALHFLKTFTACWDVLFHGEVLLLWSKFFFYSVLCWITLMFLIHFRRKCARDMQLTVHYFVHNNCYLLNSKA
jgi:hypothetical protein